MTREDFINAFCSGKITFAVVEATIVAQTKEKFVVRFHQDQIGIVMKYMYLDGDVYKDAEKINCIIKMKDGVMPKFLLPLDKYHWVKERCQSPKSISAVAEMKDMVGVFVEREQKYSTILKKDYRFERKVACLSPNECFIIGDSRIEEAIQKFQKNSHL